MPGVRLAWADSTKWSKRPARSWLMCCDYPMRRAGRIDHVRPRAAEATAAAVAAAGGLAAAGVAGARRRAARRRGAERAFRLRPDEPVAAGVRRIARGRLDMALDPIAHPADDELPEAGPSGRKKTQ